ncbi:MAG: hypothetical protein ACLFV8_13470, partial [Alphaproteobacteria bacterium]
MTDHIDEEALPLNEEVELEPGFIVRRRSLLGLIPAAACLAPSVVSGGARANPASAAAGRLSFERFLAKANPVAASLVQDTSREGQDTYLFALAALAARLLDAPEPAAWNDSGQSDEPGTWIGFNPGGEEFTVLQWRLEPGKRIRYHAHTYGNVVTVGLEGAARVRNFEVTNGEDYDFGQIVRLRMTNDQLLLPRKVNLVSLAHNYIHGFEAGPEGARGLDITTRIEPKQKTPFF